MTKRRVNKVAVLIISSIMLLAGSSAWWMLDQYNDKQNCGNNRNCFYEAYIDNCTPANLKVEFLTIEGDPITITANLEIDSNNGCSILVVNDSSQDRFGSGEVSNYICTKLSKSNNQLLGSSCVGDDLEDGDEILI